MRDGITKEEALAFVDRWERVNEFLAEEVRNAPPELRFQQLRTMIATAQTFQQTDSTADDESAIWERWRLIKERLHA